ncbi:GNAT family N-acetyltransferase [Aquimarina sp. D1M17]|uniref:GNAT family N-acetyltransferase n=1 Tax=Aquimarina acroporae TaxID=2937283 RepID=UPI0020C07050|nr:GNAT family N-acetyltransferase [Aquimarina acroporae]MCK8520335.1 GNAT family N-acetyltransferase [Aquimarina acroporae]
MYTIKLINRNKVQIIIPLLKKLNPTIPAKTLSNRLQDMLKMNYECVGVYDGEKLIGISGMWFLTKYYIGKHVEPDNVFVLPEYQGKGIGKLLIEWILDYARSKGCEASELNCYLGNEEGHKFWKSQGYELIAYHYQKKI